MKNQRLHTKSAPISEQLNQLKKRLLTETDFSVIYTRFLDNLGENPEFQKIGKVVKRPKLKTILTKIGQEITGSGHLLKGISSVHLFKLFHKPGQRTDDYIAANGEFVIPAVDNIFPGSAYIIADCAEMPA